MPDIKLNPGDAVWLYSNKEYKLDWRVKSAGYDGGGDVEADDIPEIPLDETTQNSSESSSQNSAEDGDLSIEFSECPINKVKPGYEFEDGFALQAKSTFGYDLQNVTIDILLTTNTSTALSDKYAVYSSNFYDGVLLQGGRENEDFSPYQTLSVDLNGNNKIPEDTPAGFYYIAATIDAGDRVDETNENNNVAYCKIEVVKENLDDLQNEEIEGDLSIEFRECPVERVFAGEELGDSFILEAKSSFGEDLSDVTVDIFLTSTTDSSFSDKYAVYSENYYDGVLLKGGRENEDFSPNQTLVVDLNGENKIPNDTPAGFYYIAATIDAGNKIDESNERNNVDYCKIEVVNNSNDDSLQNSVMQ
jgi:hypothetical protein